MLFVVVVLVVVEAGVVAGDSELDGVGDGSDMVPAYFIRDRRADQRSEPSRRVWGGQRSDPRHAVFIS